MSTKVELYNTDGMKWQGKLTHLPRIGEVVRINNKTMYGKFTVVRIQHDVDDCKVLIRISDFTV